MSSTLTSNPAPPPVLAAHPGRTVDAPHFDNGQEWHHALGDVPLSRIVFDPWPGTATEQDLLLFVERDRRLVELIDGTLVEKPVSFDESMVAYAIGSAVRAFVKARKLGSITGGDGMMRLKSSNRIRLPDVAFISRGRMKELPQPHPPVPVLAPDLAVEVISPSNTRAEMKQKMTEYFGSGTRLVWIVDPGLRTVAVHLNPDEPVRVLGMSESLDGGEVLPGFTMPVADVFEDLDSDHE